MLFPFILFSRTSLRQIMIYSGFMCVCACVFVKHCCATMSELLCSFSATLSWVDFRIYLCCHDMPLSIERELTTLKHVQKRKIYFLINTERWKIVFFPKALLISAKIRKLHTAKPNKTCYEMHPGGVRRKNSLPWNVKTLFAVENE